MQNRNIKHVYDLSQPICKGIPQWTGLPDLEYTDVRTFEKDGDRVSSFYLNTHFGTHIDIPWHGLREGKRLDEIPLECFLSYAVILDIPTQKEEGITPQGLIDAEKHCGLKINSGDIVIIHTDWHKKYFESSDEYLHHHPYFTVSAVQWLIGRKIKILGVDLLGTDNPLVLDTAEIAAEAAVNELNLLRNHVVIVENLGGEIDEILDLKSKPLIVVSPLPLTGAMANGSPVRVMAIEFSK